MRLALLALAVLPLPAVAQQAPVAIDCTLTILCPDVGACRDWEQPIRIREETEGWRVTWNEDLPSDYVLVADLPAPPGALEATRLVSLVYRNPETQSVQLLSFDGSGNLTVSGHQPQAGARIVSGIGTCEPAE